MTLFITVEYFLAFLPCLRFPLSFGSMLACRLLEGATWSPAWLPGVEKAPLDKDSKEVLEA